MAFVAELTDVKTWMAIAPSETALDAALTTLLESVDAAFETYVGRELRITRRTELIPRVRGGTLISLRHPPIISVQSVHVDEERLWTSSTLVDPTDYTVLSEQGQIAFEFELPKGYQVVRVVYDGGLASDAADFKTRHPRIHHMALQQVQYEYQRRNTAGASSEVAMGASKVHTAQVKLLDVVKEALAPHRIVRV